MLYLNSVETESLTGPEAVSKATKCTLALRPRPTATMVHFKVSAQGITLTDSKRRYMTDTPNLCSILNSVDMLAHLIKIVFFFFELSF